MRGDDLRLFNGAAVLQIGRDASGAERMAADTRRLVQLTIESSTKVNELLDMLLAKKRSADRKIWLEKKGDQAEIL